LAQVLFSAAEARGAVSRLQPRGAGGPYVDASAAWRPLVILRGVGGRFLFWRPPQFSYASRKRRRAAPHTPQAARPHWRC